ncbi:MAG: L,D-transpeptidase family protein [Chitinophagaceae bacterium]|nr:L,D-transpeptidase family protein [Chitinophagaceae bacterium]
MKFGNTLYRNYSACILMMLLLACNNNKVKDPGKVTNPAEMNSRVAGNIHDVLNADLFDTGKIDDSTKLHSPDIIQAFYSRSDHRPVWSSMEKWIPMADTLFRFIAQAEQEGLFPADYHFTSLKFLKDTLDADSLTRMHAALWTKADLLLTDGFMHIIRDLKQGRLQPDSLSLNKDSVLVDKFFITTLNELLVKKKFNALLASLQPVHKNYWELKKGIKQFVDGMDRRETVYIPFPFKRGDVTDSIHFIKLLQQRLLDNACIDPLPGLPDSARLYVAIKKYQLKKGLQADGKYGKNLVNSLNSTDIEKFKRIAITLDRYKQLPAKMPEKYIWVNVPGYLMRVVDADTVVFESKVIIGKPETRTPLLTAEISDMITYPTWTVPNSIIVKQYLPRLKNNSNYISKIGLKLYTNKGEEIDPNTVNWSKYSRGIPYKVMQGSGDNNSLGVIKFNFNNPYAVYLHDTNQRYLFKSPSRALSHGCVRVQEWENWHSLLPVTTVCYRPGMRH